MPLCHQEYYILCLPLLWTALAPAQADEERLPMGFMIGYFLVYVLLTRPWPVSGGGLQSHHDGLKSLLVTMPFIGGALLWALTLRAICVLKTTPAS